MPNKERIRKWVAALRSGEYEQAQMKLRDDDGFCCLGVACDVFHKETGKGEWKAGGFAMMNIFAKEAFPDSVSKWFGIETSYGLPELAIVTENDNGMTHTDYIEASILNDEWEYDFDQIADAIERTYL